MIQKKMAILAQLVEEILVAWKLLKWLRKLHQWNKENLKQNLEKRDSSSQSNIVSYLATSFTASFEFILILSSLTFNDVLFAVLAHEILKRDWLEDNKHSWHNIILGVHDFPSHTVIQYTRLHKALNFWNLLWSIWKYNANININFVAVTSAFFKDNENCPDRCERTYIKYHTKY